MTNNTALLEDAKRLQQAGRMPEAARAYAHILKAEPSNFQALYQLGLILFQYRQFADADRLLTTAVRINPNSPELSYNRGCVFQQLGRHEEALAAFARALAIAPDFSEARNNRGVTLLSLGRAAEALACFDRVLKQHPQLATLHNNRATALLALRRPEEALSAADSALHLQQLPDAFFNRGSALAALDRCEEALSCFEQALAREPQHVDALVYRGIVLERLDRPAEALDSYDAALRIRPGDADILFNRTSALAALGRFDAVVADCNRVLAADPHFKYAEGSRLFAKLQCCDWEDLASWQSTALAHQRAGYRVFQPLQAISMLTSGEDLRDSSRIWVAHEFPASEPPIWSSERYRHDRIRVAYVSGDFSFHPVMLLAAGMFERHDRGRFEVTAISTVPHDGSDLRHRLEAAFEHFIDLRDQSPQQIAQLIHNREIDIVVDLMGYTKGAPTAVFAQRPAGIQVSFLGFPGTTAAPYFDYIIADKPVAGEDRQHHFSEKIVWLPNSYLPNDNKRSIGAQPSRAEAGLPESGFVFCNFGKAYKITPEIFAAWMRLLSQTPGSVLWLAVSNATAQHNLRREAAMHGVESERLLFASFVTSPEDHLARISLADLFLDTFPYNAHATACDFLWVGVPVVTLAGGGFAGRVGASVLSAAGLDQLITDSVPDYEQLALHLAHDPADLRSTKDMLAGNRSKCPLFDTERFTCDLESAYQEMWRRHQNGETPASFVVTSGSTFA